MEAVVAESVDALLEEVAPEPDEIQTEMGDLAIERGFPFVGPVIGGILYQLTQCSDANAIFEFGSGFGYSASWFARGLDASGSLVLTEYDEDELEEAREFFDRAGYAPTIAFESGDALAAIKSYEGPFDIVLIDHEKSRYPETMDVLAGKLAPGALVLADNALSGGAVDHEEVHAMLRGDDEGVSESSAGVATLIDRLRTEYNATCSILPIGEGLLIANLPE